MIKVETLSFNQMHYFSVVDENHYQLVTSLVRGTTLVGYFIGSLLSQLLVSLAYLDYFYLNVISLVNVFIAFFISLILPMPKTSLFFFAKKEKEEYNHLQQEKKSDALLNVSDSAKMIGSKQSIENKRSLVSQALCSNKFTLLDNLLF